MLKHSQVLQCLYETTEIFPINLVVETRLSIINCDQTFLIGLEIIAIIHNLDGSSVSKRFEDLCISGSSLGPLKMNRVKYLGGVPDILKNHENLWGQGAPIPITSAFKSSSNEIFSKATTGKSLIETSGPHKRAVCIN